MRCQLILLHLGTSTLYASAYDLGRVRDLTTNLAKCFITYSMGRARRVRYVSKLF